MCLRCVVNGSSILKTAVLCWKFLKNLRKGLNMWVMAKMCGKWLKNMRRG